MFFAEIFGCSHQLMRHCGNCRSITLPKLDDAPLVLSHQPSHAASYPDKKNAQVSQ